MSKTIGVVIAVAGLSLGCATSGTVSPGAAGSLRQPFSVQVTGSGPPMILIPGLMSSGKVWDEALAHYRARYTCHVLTLEGFAGQPAVDGPFIPTVLAGIEGYLREQHLDHPVLVGHSLGGFLALELAARRPARRGAGDHRR